MEAPRSSYSISSIDMYYFFFIYTSVIHPIFSFLSEPTQEFCQKCYTPRSSNSTRIKLLPALKNKRKVRNLVRFASKSKHWESRLPKLKLLALKSHKENANILSIKCLACGFTERNLSPLPSKVQTNSQLEEILPKVAQTSQKKKKKKKRKSNLSQNGSLVNNQLNQSISSAIGESFPKKENNSANTKNANNKTKANTKNANNKTKENIKNNPNDSSISKLNKSSIKIAKQKSKSPKISLVTKNSKPNQTAKKISALKEALQHTKSIQKSKSSLKSFLDSVF